MAEGWQGAGTSRKFYITTPIYYPSSNLHIGHAYTTVAADAIARFMRKKGYDVFFVTGTDEHGQKIQRKAMEAGKSPKEFVDEIVANIKQLWSRLHISYDDFIRTTEDRHIKVVQALFQRLYDQGDIYKSQYEGWYCTPCETFWLERELKDGSCPDCGSAVELVQEESYFFRMSKYGDRMLEFIEQHEDFIQPPSRRNEMISFIKSGLEDLCVSRTTFNWGIPVPFDNKHVIYVWVDALTNYITAAGYLWDEAKFNRYWPADVHLVGKEIVRFHTIIWPIILMAAGIELPKKVFGHGWLVLESGKMSKSKGNVIDPNVLVDKYGVDAVRYFLLREIPFGSDGYYSEDALIQRVNSDLANDLGNLVYRTLSMLTRFCDSRIPPMGKKEPVDDEICSLAGSVVKEVELHMERLEISDALSSIWKLIRRCNKYIDETAPWSLARRAETRDRLHAVFYTLCECLRIISILLAPFLTDCPKKIWQQLGLPGDVESQTLEDAAQWGKCQPGLEVRRGEPLFPRIEIPQTDSGFGTETVQPKVSIEEFRKLDLRIGEVVGAQVVQGADRLLTLTVRVGQEQRQIVAGLAKSYHPQQLIGKQVVVVANLEPATIRGIESQGMILAASDGNDVAIVVPDKPISSGVPVL